DLPTEAVLNAKLCLIDAVACAIFGAGFPWSRAVIDLIAAFGATGRCAVPGAAGRGGRDMIAAIVAGCEASFRIGAATLHTPELAGFHAPGIVGPFGSAIASVR